MMRNERQPMMELLTAAQMRAVEQAAIDCGAVTGLELMERAGRGVVEAIHEKWPRLAATPGRAMALCGPGNNGGDGFVVARLLKERGWAVDVCVYGEPTRLPPDAATNYARWRELGEVRDAAEIRDEEATAGFDLLIDALFGTGLSRPISDEVICRRLQAFYEATAASAHRCDDLQNTRTKTHTVAIDTPSGLCADSGRVLVAPGAGVSCPRAMLTVSFHRPKRGHYLGEGPIMSGVLVTKDIGLDGRLSGLGPDGFGEFARLAQPAASRLGKGDAGHKFSYGHALVIAGGVGRGGAARLAARGALRIGAGLVTVGAPPAAIIENAAQLNAIMLTPVKGAEGLADVLADTRINAIIAGPGLGVAADTRALVGAALRAGRSAVLDADALSSFAEEPEQLFADTCGANVVLTPHMGEFARLFPDLAERLAEPPMKGPAYSKADAAKDAARRAGCVVLLKGPDTVVADADSASIVSAAYDDACPWLATAGAGDVLAGFIGGLMARGFPGGLAAETGAWLHQECARSFGPGLISEDLPEMLPKVLRELGV